MNTVQRGWCVDQVCSVVKGPGLMFRTVHLSPLNFGNQKIRATSLSFLVMFSQGNSEHCMRFCRFQCRKISESLGILRKSVETSLAAYVCMLSISRSPKLSSWDLSVCWRSTTKAAIFCLLSCRHWNFNHKMPKPYLEEGNPIFTWRILKRQKEIWKLQKDWSQKVCKFSLLKWQRKIVHLWTICHIREKEEVAFLSLFSKRWLV